MVKRCSYGYPRPSLEGEPEEIDTGTGPSMGIVYLVSGIIIGLFIIKLLS